MESLKRRDRIEIYSDILEAAKDGATKREISNKALMSNNRANAYLDYLKKFKLLEQSGQIYTTNNKGLDFLSKYNGIAELLQLEDKVVID